MTAALAHVVPVARLRAWFDTAPTGGQAVYATGTIAPSEGDTAEQVLQWQTGKLVAVKEQRDPAQPTALLFLVEKLGKASHG